MKKQPIDMQEVRNANGQKDPTHSACASLHLHAAAFAPGVGSPQQRPQPLQAQAPAPLPLALTAGIDLSMTRRLLSMTRQDGCATTSNHAGMLKSDPLHSIDDFSFSNLPHLSE